MHDLGTVAPAFVDVAHRIVWASVATIDSDNRPRSRVLHPLWEFDGDDLVGWVGTVATPLKRAHLDHSPFASVNYWDSRHDVATAECKATWHFDDATCTRVWNLLKHAPEPVGYDPAMIPVWTEPTAPEFSVLRLDPWRLRVFPGSLVREGVGEPLDWRAH